MMDWLMRALAPRNALGFIVRLGLLICFVAAANFAFSALVNDHSHEPIYYIAHAAFVGGPLIAFFLTVTVFQIRLQQKLSRLSRKDGLTGLNNRRSFFELAQRARATSPTGVLLILDADRFKAINDTYGHDAGDRCLKSVAFVIRRNLRKEDIVGRIGGEEFAIYLYDLSASQARVIGERLTMPITFHTRDDEALTVTLSIGAAVSSKDTSLDDLFVLADKALYQAKLNGRARLEFFDQSIAA